MTLCPGSQILGNAKELPDLPLSLKISGSQLKLSSGLIGQGERNLNMYVSSLACTSYCAHDPVPFKK